jgi:hypothetical protein
LKFWGLKRWKVNVFCGNVRGKYYENMNMREGGDFDENATSGRKEAKIACGEKKICAAKN